MYCQLLDIRVEMTNFLESTLLFIQLLNNRKCGKIIWMLYLLKISIMNCPILVKNIQVIVPSTFSVFLVIDAFDTLFNRKYSLMEEIKRYY